MRFSAIFTDIKTDCRINWTFRWKHSHKTENTPWCSNEESIIWSEARIFSNEVPPSWTTRHGWLGWGSFIRGEARIFRNEVPPSWTTRHGCLGWVPIIKDVLTLYSIHPTIQFPDTIKPTWSRLVYLFGRQQRDGTSAGSMGPTFGRCACVATSWI